MIDTSEKIHNMKEKYCYLSLLDFNNQKCQVVQFTNTGSIYQHLSTFVLDSSSEEEVED